MRAIAKPHALIQNVLPVIIHVIIQRHWVCHDFHALIQTAVGFDVDTIIRAVAYFQNGRCVVIIMTTNVNFKFHTKITVAFAIEDWLRLKTIFVNSTALFVETVVTQAFIPMMIGIIDMKHSITIVTSGVVVLIAVLTQTVVIVAINIIVIDQCSTSFTTGAVIFYTVSADDFPMNKAEIIIRNDSSAV